jgi:hypothetical protein
MSNRPNHGDFVPAQAGWNQGGMLGSHNFSSNDATFTSVEDLGQFWLWDVDNFNF